MMRVWKYGDSVNTDMLFPGKYCYTCSTDEEIIPQSAVRISRRTVRVHWWRFLSGQGVR